MLKATTPGKERTARIAKPYPIRANAIVISIKPLTDIYLDDRPDHNEQCCIVWENGKRKIKFISRACPNHRFTECLVEQAN